MNDTQTDDPTIPPAPDTNQPSQPENKPPEPIGLPIAAPKKKWYKRKSLLVTLLLVFVLGGAGTGYAYYAATQKPAQKETAVAATTPKPSPSETPKTYAPFALQYSSDKQTSVKGTDCLVMQTTVYQKPIAGGDATVALTVPDYQQAIKQIPTDNGHVILITAPSCYSKEGPGLWVSKDAGKTYTQLYKGKPHPKDSYGEQITSALLADDGKTIVFATVPSADSKGTVKTLDIESKKTTDLFTASEPGVLLQGYDMKKKTVFYYAGCYNCAGFSFSKPLVHDLAKNTDTPLFNDTEYMAYSSVMSDDLSKILRVKNKGERIPKVDLSYVIEEYDIDTKKATAIASFKRTDESGTVNAGYTSDGSVYYSNNKDLLVAREGKAASLLMTTRPIINVYYVGKEQVVLTQGDQSGGSAISYAIDTKASTALVDYKYPTSVLGISLQ